MIAPGSLPLLLSLGHSQEVVFCLPRLLSRPGVGGLRDAGHRVWERICREPEEYDPGVQLEGVHKKDLHVGRGSWLQRLISLDSEVVASVYKRTGCVLFAMSQSHDRANILVAPMAKVVEEGDYGYMIVSSQVQQSHFETLIARSEGAPEGGGGDPCQVARAPCPRCRGLW